MQDNQSKLNHDLQEEFNYNETFRNKMLERQQQFKDAKATLAFQPDLKIPQDILQIFSLESNVDTFFYYAFMQPKQKEMTPELTLFLIKNFNPRLNIDLQKFHKKYKFVFFNNCVDNTQIYYEFKNIFLTLPIDYFLALDEFIFVKPTFSQKVFQWWVSDDIEKYFKAKTRYVSSIAELCPILGTSISKLIEFLPKNIVVTEFPQEANKVRQRPINVTNYRMNVQGQSRNSEQQTQFDNFVKVMGTFFQNSKNEVYEIDQYVPFSQFKESNEVKMPYVLQELFTYFDQHPEKLMEQGLFRKSVSIDQENQTLAELMKSNFSYLKTVTNPHLIANLIKRFFAKLKTPIIPYENFSRLMKDQGVQDKAQFIKENIKNLQKQNLFPLMFLLEFLVEKVLPVEKYTKMNSNAVAICFAPCLLRQQTPSQFALLYATKSSNLVREMLNNFEKIFGTKQERQKFVQTYLQGLKNKWKSDLKTEIEIMRSKSERMSKSFQTKQNN